MGIIDEKPKSMSMSNFFIKKTAVKTLIPESIVELVVKDQFKQLNDSIKSHNLYDHQLSGFGSFQISNKKLGRQLNSVSEKLVKLAYKRRKILKENGGGNMVSIEESMKFYFNTIETLIKLISVCEERGKKVNWTKKFMYDKAIEINQELPKL